MRRPGRTVPLLAIATALLLAVATAPRPALGEGLAVYPCVASGFDLCLLQGRFRATLSWNDGSGPRPAWVAQPRTDSASSSSGLFYFYASTPSNWEALVKIVDGCRTNDAFWILVSAATGFGWELVVTDELAGVTKTFTHPLDGHASGFADFSSFSTCAVPTPTPTATPEPVVTPTPFVTSTPAPTPTPRPTPFALVEFRIGKATCFGFYYEAAVLQDPNHAWNAYGAPLEVVEPSIGPFDVLPLYGACPDVHFPVVWEIQHGYKYRVIFSGRVEYGGALDLLNLGPIYGTVASAFLGGSSESLVE